MLLKVSYSPHIHSGLTIQKVMQDVIISLLPACVVSVYFFGFRAFFVICISILSCVLIEFFWQKFILKTHSTISDSSAALTGLLFALTLPPTIPYWQVIIGCIFSIIFGKQIFGGLGYNPFNPALIGRAFMQVSWPQNMTSWTMPLSNITCATPLEIIKNHLPNQLPTITDLLIGNRAGSLGETASIALILGGIYLLWKKHITYIIPVFYITTVVIMSVLFGQNVVYQVLSGGLLLGAIFMATDPVTSPVSKTGKIIFGIGCGIMTSLIRFNGGFPEGVCFSILILNMFVPIIDKFTIPKPFGKK